VNRIGNLLSILAISLLSFNLGHQGSMEAAACARPSFAGASTVDVGTAPVFIAKGDFNGDGKVDLAVANSGSGNVSILLGVGDGNFQPGVSYQAGSGAIFVGVADFNTDGKQDLVVANEGSSNISILLGNGDGTFQNAVNYVVGFLPVAVAIGDFNGDGKLDLVTANSGGSPSMSILLGNGNGTFQSAVALPYGSPVQFVVAGDFNGDGKMDLAVAQSGSTTVSILLGNGDGTFQTPANYTVGSGPYAITVGDLNGDGKMDLAVANNASDNVSILLGNGDGSFQSAANFGAGSGPVYVAIADFNGDGKADLAVANFSSDNVSFLLGNGNGTFQTPVNYGGGSAPAVGAVGDFNGDGKPDLAVTFNGSNYVLPLLNTCAGACPTITISPSSLPPAVVGQAYSQTLSASGGAPNYSFAVTGGTFPSGMGISSAGEIAGTPTIANSYNFTVTATDASSCTGSSPYTLVVGGGHTSLNLSVPAGGAVTGSTQGGTSTASVGYAVVNLNSGTAPYGTAVFSVTQGGIVVSEAGVPESPPTTKGRIFIDLRPSVAAKTDRSATGTISINTGVAIVNRGSALAHILLTLRDRYGALVGTPGHATLVAGGHRALYVDQIASSGFAPDFVLPPSFATTTNFGTLEIEGDQPLSILAMRQTTNQRSEALFTTTPSADMTLPTNSNPLYFPQMADGGGLKTTIVLLSTDTSNAETGRINFFDNNGAPLSVRPMGGSTAQSSFPYSVPAGGLFRFETDGSSSPATVGWVQLIADSGSKSPVGAGVYSYTPSGILIFESGVPSATPTTHARIYVDTSVGSSGTRDTGLAIANPAGAPLTFTLNAFQMNGSTPAGNGPVSPNLTGNGHIAQYAGQFITGLPSGFTGVLDISSASPFVAVTLRALTNTRGETLYTTFPIADMTQAAPSPLIFPQIAEGGGVRSQFILISPGGAANTTINFFGDDGSPLSVAKTDRTKK
jgi:hypothetical protein